MTLSIGVNRYEDVGEGKSRTPGKRGGGDSMGGGEITRLKRTTDPGWDVPSEKRPTTLLMWEDEKWRGAEGDVALCHPKVLIIIMYYLK